MVKVDLTGAAEFFCSGGPDYARAAEAHRVLVDGTGAGSEFTGWLSLAQLIRDTELKRLVDAAAKIRESSQALVVIGIGGSYLGARAAIDLLRPPAHRDDPDIYFAGNGLSPDALNEILDQLGDRDFSVNVISKSGTTLEPALAFRVFLAKLKEKYGAQGARKRVYATTDARRGALKKLADAEGYECFVVPDDVGGRYSVLSAVGLLPMAVAGIDIRRVISAAIEEMEALNLRSPENPAWQYAAARQNLYQGGRGIEILGCYEPRFRYMGEWWKQLYGESEGKNGVGIFPASVELTADLHSMGQYIQDGPRTMLETIVSFDESLSAHEVPFAMGDPDGLNYLAGRDFAEISRVAKDAVKAAHIAGGVPNIELHVPRRDEEGFAALVCFFELACAISGYISGVNPFDQPGVEAYKKNMFKMLGKPE
jgi:glucose-6-phosphate isomerase